MNNKEKIIHSALQLFAENGYAETSIDKIAKHAKVSKGLTYTHFKNKEDLLRACVEASVLQLTDEMMQLQETSLESLLRNLFHQLKAHTQRVQLSLLLVIHPKTPEVVNEMLSKQREELLQLLASLLPQQGDVRLEAELLLNLIDGITLDYVADPQEAQINTRIDYLINKYNT